MKPSFRNLVLATFISLGQSSHAASIYWDTNSTTAGSGAATGTWGVSSFWSTSTAGTVTTTGTLPTANDDVFIAAGTTGTTGTITIDSARVAGSLTLEEPAANPGVIISGGTSLTLGGGSTATKGLFVTGNGTHTISTPLILSGANTIQNAGTGTLTVNGGISGTGNLNLRNNNTSGTGVSIYSQPINITGDINCGGSNSGFIIIGNSNAATASAGTGSGGLSSTVTSFTQDSTNSPSEFLNANNSAYAGNYDINAGTLHWAGTNTGGTVTATNSASIINLGATTGTAAATMNVINNAVSGKVNNNIKVRAGSTGIKTIGVALTGSGVTFTTTGTITLDDNVTFSPNSNSTFNPNGLISDGANGAKGITKTGVGTVNLSLAHNFTGTTTVTTGPLILTGTNGSLPNTSGITISGGTLQLNNTISTNNTNRIPDATVISLTSGTLDFKNDAALLTDYSETISLTAGSSGTINTSQAATGQSSTLTIGTFSRLPGASLNFTGIGLGIDSRNRVLFTTSPAINGVIPWATAGNTTFAAYDNTNGVSPAITTDLDAQGSTIADDATSNLRILPDGSGAEIALAATTTTINTLVEANVNAAVNPTIDTASKTLLANGILVATGARPLTIGTAPDSGLLSAATAGGELYLNNSSANALTLNATIQNNTRASTVAITGSGSTTFAGTNTYTGGTAIAGGIITATTASAFGTGDISINRGALRLVINDSTTLSNNLTINGGGVVSRGLIENSGAGEAVLSGTITINALTYAGGHFASTSTGTLKITGAINSSSAAVSSRIGTVIFAGGGSYANFIINQGTAKLGATDGLSTSATADIAVSNTGNLDLAGYNQSLAGITRSGTNNTATIGNSSTANNSILTITGTSTYSGGITNVIGTGDKLTTLKIANGANLTLTGTYTADTPDIKSGGILTIGAGGGDGISPSTKKLLVPSGATLKFTGANRVQNDTVITVNSGGTFDLNGQADTIGYLSGSGSITNLNAGLTLNLPLAGSGSDFSGSISGTSGISLAGAGTGATDTSLQILSGVNTFTGNVNVQHGILRITNSSALGAAPAAGTKTININATNNKVLELDGALGNITLPSSFLFSTSSVNGAIRNLAGDNTIDGAFSLTSGNGNTKIISDAGSLTLNGNITTIAGAGSNRVFDLDGTSTGNNAVTGIISNGGGFLTGVTKSGAGKWTLSGANTYTSATTVNGGTLHLTGSIATGSAVTVGGATATGTPTLTGAGGTVNGTLNIAAAGAGAAGTVNPGTVGTTGTLNAGATTIAGTYACDVTAAASDLLAVTGNLDITGATLAVNAISPGASSYTIATYTGTLNGSFTVSPALPAGYTLDYATTGVIKLVLTATPYDIWMNGYPSITGSDKLPAADPDGDGMSNQQEFAFGLIPDNGSSLNAITVQLDKNSGQFTYQRLTASGLTYTIWTSTDLVVWTEDTSAIQTPTTVGANESVQVTLSDSKPLTAPKTFVRVAAN